MTTEQKSKVTRWLEFIPKAITPALLVIILWKGGQYMQKAQDRQFPTIEDKVRTLDHVNKSLDPVQLHELKEHIGNKNFHMPKTAKDSVYVTRKEFEEIYGRTAVQVYQINKKLDNIQPKED